MPCEISNDRESKTAWFTRALNKDRFETWYQPVIDTSGHRILGHECLIRHTDEQTRDGEQIFEAARAHNVVQAFDSRAMVLAVRSASQQTGNRGVFFVNMLAGSISDPGVAMRPALEAMSSSSLKPRDLVFETVDSDLTGDSARLHAVHDYLRNHGFGFGLDNAGGGSSSLGLIRDLRPDYVKIDRQLVRNAEQPVCAATIRKIVELADRYGSEAIAVGVERPRMVENLWLLGVKIMQGYLFGRPSRRVAKSGGPILSSAGTDLANLASALEPPPPSVLHQSPLFADLN
jgi:EAL domain-containing protein (putative c-di-GMP-specific phosphodiesterase class I)